MTWVKRNDLQGGLAALEPKQFVEMSYCVYDSHTAMYIKISSNKVERTTTVDDFVNIDYDEEDRVVGIEILP